LAGRARRQQGPGVEAVAGGARVVGRRDAQRREAGGGAQRERGRRQRGRVRGEQAAGRAGQAGQAQVQAQEDAPVELAAVGGALRARDMALSAAGRFALAAAESSMTGIITGLLYTVSCLLPCDACTCKVQGRCKEAVNHVWSCRSTH